jgi:hypothetical protein
VTFAQVVAEAERIVESSALENSMASCSWRVAPDVYAAIVESAKDDSRFHGLRLLGTAVELDERLESGRLVLDELV